MEKFLLTQEQAIEAWGKYQTLTQEVRKQISIFEIYAKPDLNEGRYTAEPQGFVLVRLTPTLAERGLLAENLLVDFMHNVYGNKIVFGMGGFIAISWKYKLVDAITSAWPHMNRLLQVIEPEPLDPGDRIWDIDFYSISGSKYNPS